MKEVDLDAALRQRGWAARRVLMATLVGVLVLLTISSASRQGGSGTSCELLS